MAIRPVRSATIVGAGALVAALILSAMAKGRESPVGAGESIEWLLTYLMLLGFPTSLAVAPLRFLSPGIVKAAMIFAVAVNWALAAFIVAKIIQLLGRKPRTDET